MTASSDPDDLRQADDLDRRAERRRPARRPAARRQQRRVDGGDLAADLTRQRRRRWITGALRRPAGHPGGRRTDLRRPYYVASPEPGRRESVTEFRSVIVSYNDRAVLEPTLGRGAGASCSPASKARSVTGSTSRPSRHRRRHRADTDRRPDRGRPADDVDAEHPHGRRAPRRGRCPVRRSRRGAGSGDLGTYQAKIDEARALHLRRRRSSSKAPDDATSSPAGPCARPRPSNDRMRQARAGAADAFGEFGEVLAELDLVAGLLGGESFGAVVHRFDVVAESRSPGWRVRSTPT